MVLIEDMAIAAFEEALAINGTKIIIIVETPVLDENDQPVKDDNKRIVTESSEKELDCTMTWKNSVIKTDEGYTKGRVKDVTAKFRKTDAQYLTQKNKAIYTSPSGLISNFTIGDAIERNGHIEVKLN